jgi:hypothetical protein
MDEPRFSMSHADRRIRSRAETFAHVNLDTLKIKPRGEPPSCATCYHIDMHCDVTRVQHTTRFRSSQGFLCDKTLVCAAQHGVQHKWSALPRRRNRTCRIPTAPCLMTGMLFSVLQSEARGASLLTEYGRASVSNPYTYVHTLHKQYALSWYMLILAFNKKTTMPIPAYLIQ